MVNKFSNIRKCWPVFYSIPGRIPTSSTNLEMFHLSSVGHAQHEVTHTTGTRSDQEESVGESVGIEEGVGLFAGDGTVEPRLHAVRGNGG